MKLENLTGFPFWPNVTSRQPAGPELPFGRMEAAAAAAVFFLVVGLVGCHKTESAFGRLHFEGSDPMGPFSGDIEALYCLGSFEPTGVTIRGTRSGGIDTGTEAYPFLLVWTTGANWKLMPSDCRTLDLRLWFDGDKHQHVAVRVDCTTRGLQSVHVTGSVGSDECLIKRPGTPRT